MFDWISMSTKKSETRSKIEDFCNKNYINIESTVSDQGEILNSGNRFIEYRGIKIILLSNGCVKLMFSLHKLYNELHGIYDFKNQAMNHDTFDFSKVKYIITWLELNFQIDPMHTLIHQLEFGFNLSNLIIDSKTIIDQFIAYKDRRFNSLDVIGLGYGIEVLFPKYYKIKIYDKALQYRLPQQILRIEYKALRLKSIEFKIFNGDNMLCKLLEIDTWKRCKDFILEQIQSCIISDNFEYKTRHDLFNWENPKFWEFCKAHIRYKAKTKFERFIKENGIFQTKTILINDIDSEYKKMIVGHNFH